jgi:hypothetical protein
MQIKKNKKYNFLNKFQYGLPWWHDKYPDDIRPRSTFLEVCFVLLQPQCPLCGLSDVEGR